MKIVVIYTMLTCRVG